MRTPAGKECPYFYANYKRGADRQECRLIEDNPDSARWHPNDCANCRVPEITAANASPNLMLKLTIKQGLLGLPIGRRLIIDARCDKHKVTISDAIVGCPQCNAERPGFDIFMQALGEDEE